MQTVDLFMFMGQSNMAGRAAVSAQWPQPAPQLYPGAGLEFRAVSDPTRLWPIEEPFGFRENRRNGINDKENKTGSMVTAFVNAYFAETGVPVVGISASKGGSSIVQWQPERGFLQDARARLAEGLAFLDARGIAVRHRFMLWCQGETDGDYGRSAQEYRQYFDRMLDTMKGDGIQHCFLVLIGEYNGSEGFSYEEIRRAQRQLAEERTDVTLVSERFERMKARGLMRDSYHYFQQAYNEVGAEAGENVGRIVKRAF